MHPSLPSLIFEGKTKRGVNISLWSPDYDGEYQIYLGERACYVPSDQMLGLAEAVAGFEEFKLVKEV